MKRGHINVVAPLFERPAGAPTPGPPPQTRAEWDALYTTSYAVLKGRGLARWDDTNPVLMLFPFEWFDAIPAGFKVLSVTDKWYAFDPVAMVEQRDKRTGLLPFGILVSR